MSVATPHFAAPFAFDGHGRAVVVEQDTQEEREARAYNVTVCAVGFREDAPDFGIPEPLFKNVPLNPAPTQQAIKRWAGVNATVGEGEGNEPAQRRLVVEVA